MGLRLEICCRTDATLGRVEEELRSQPRGLPYEEKPETTHRSKGRSPAAGVMSRGGAGGGGVEDATRAGLVVREARVSSLGASGLGKDKEGSLPERATSAV